MKESLKGPLYFLGCTALGGGTLIGSLYAIGWFTETIWLLLSGREEHLSPNYVLSGLAFVVVGIPIIAVFASIGLLIVENIEQYLEKSKKRKRQKQRDLI